MSDRADAAPPLELLYVTLEDDFATFDPGAAECYWRGVVDPAIGPGVRRDLYCHRATWIEAAYVDADGAAVPHPRKLRRGKICPFRELSIDEVLHWFAASPRPLPRVVSMDRIWWGVLGPLARDQLGAAEPPPDPAEPIYPPKPPPSPPPTPRQDSAPARIGGGTPPPPGASRRYGGPPRLPTYGPGQPVMGPVPPELKAAFPDARWAAPRPPQGYGRPGHALPFYATFPPSESDTPPAVLLGEAERPLRPQESSVPATPVQTNVANVAVQLSESSALAGTITSMETDPLPGTPESIANALTRARKHVRARLVEYMANRLAAEFADIANEVHGDATVGESTIRANVDRTNDELAAHAAPFRFRCAGAKVFKEFDPVASCNGDAAQT